MSQNNTLNTVTTIERKPGLDIMSMRKHFMSLTSQKTYRNISSVQMSWNTTEYYSLLATFRCHSLISHTVTHLVQSCLAAVAMVTLVASVVCNWVKVEASSPSISPWHLCTVSRDVNGRGQSNWTGFVLSVSLQSLVHANSDRIINRREHRGISW